VPRRSGDRTAWPEIWNGSIGRVARRVAGHAVLSPDLRGTERPRVYAGELPQSAYLDPAGGGNWTPVAISHYGRRDYGSAVMYAPGKVLIVGGSDPADGPPTASAETIDLVGRGACVAVHRVRWPRRVGTSTRRCFRTVESSRPAAPAPGDSATSAGPRMPPRCGPGHRRLEHLGECRGEPRLPLDHAAAAGRAAAPCRQRRRRQSAAGAERGAVHAPYLLHGPRPAITSAPVERGLRRGFSGELARRGRGDAGDAGAATLGDARVRPESAVRAGGVRAQRGRPHRERTPECRDRCHRDTYMLFLLDADGIRRRAHRSGSVRAPGRTRSSRRRRRSNRTGESARDPTLGAAALLLAGHLLDAGLDAGHVERIHQHGRATGNLRRRAPVVEVTTGAPQAMASTIGRPNPS